MVLRNVSASECLRDLSVDCVGGAGTTNDDIFDSTSGVDEEECTFMGNSGGAFDF